MEVLLTSVLGAIICFEASKFQKLGALRASALSTLVFGFVLYLVGIREEVYLAAFYGASFAGMSCPTRFARLGIALSGLVFGLLFTLLVPHLQGYGGALGVSAFVSVCSVLLAQILFTKIAKLARF